MKFIRLIFENMGRNKLRSALTALGTMMLVVVVTLVWSVLNFLDQATSEKSTNLKAIVTERWRIPSQMPFAYAASLKEGAAVDAKDTRPADSMTWSFYGGSLDPENRTRENSLFAFCLEPEKLLTMMDELDTLPPEKKAPLEKAVARMKENRRGAILGKERLAAINKRVGDRFVLHSINYRGIDLEMEIVGVFPEGRYDNSAAMNIEYLNAALDQYPTTHAGQKHPMADKSLNLVWLRLPDREQFARVSEQILGSPSYKSPSVKVETASSGISTFLEAYRDIFWGMRWLLAPAILITMSLVISNAISISVRERRIEFGILKVLGFKPRHVMVLVLGESLLLGTLAGFLSAVLTYWVINHMIGGIKFPIAFFPAFFIPLAGLWWGPVVGAGTAFLGSFFPAWSARTVRVSEVFSKVA